MGRLINPEARARDVIVIGASAGGIEAVAEGGDPLRPPVDHRTGIRTSV
jgi:hypothetical protein